MRLIADRREVPRQEIALAPADLIHAGVAHCVAGVLVPSARAQPARARLGRVAGDNRRSAIAPTCWGTVTFRIGFPVGAHHVLALEGAESSHRVAPPHSGPALLIHQERKTARGWIGTERERVVVDFLQAAAPVDVGLRAVVLQPRVSPDDVVAEDVATSGVAIKGERPVYEVVVFRENELARAEVIRLVPAFVSVGAGSCVGELEKEHIGLVRGIEVVVVEDSLNSIDLKRMVARNGIVEVAMVNANRRRGPANGDGSVGCRARRWIKGNATQPK